jgi:hypothetical protein
MAMPRKEKSRLPEEKGQAALGPEIWRKTQVFDLSASLRRYYPDQVHRVG